MPISLNPIRFYTEDDPYHISVDNRPLTDLADNQNSLRNELVRTQTGLTGNRIAGGGRFANPSSSLNFTLSDTTDPFHVSSFFTPNNGCIFSEAGKFINNNSSFGGAAGAINQTTIDLLAAMNRTGLNCRYGVEFRLAEVSVGAGTSNPFVVPSRTAYLVTTSNYAATAVGGPEGYMTFCGWVRAISGRLSINDPSELYLNEVLQPGSIDILPSAGWVHVRIISRTLLGYDNAFPYLLGVSGDVFQMALPALFAGYADIGIHTSPVPDSASILV